MTTMSTVIRDKVQAWLKDDGWTLGEQSVLENAWAFIVEDNTGRKIIVEQKPNREDELIIHSSIVVDEVTAQKIGELPEGERNELIWDLRFELLKTELEFQGVQFPLRQVQVGERIFIDALTKDAFLRRTANIRRGILAVMWVLGRKFSR